jgi:hypothetical protein
VTLAFDATPWARVEVGEDDRTLRLRGIEVPAEGRWRLDCVRAVEHDEAVVVRVGVIEADGDERWSFRRGDDVDAEVRLRAPLAGRPVLPAAWGTLVRPSARPRGASDCEGAVRVEHGFVPAAGVLVVAWRGPIACRLDAVDVAREGDVLRVALRLWEHGGKLGFTRYMAVVDDAEAVPGLRVE